MENKKKSVIFAGGIFRDLVTLVPKFPAAGETVFGEDFFKGFGGKSANQSVAAKLLSGPELEIYFTGKVGRDDYGQDYLNHFRSLDIHTDYVFQSSTRSTGIASIFVETTTAQNRIAVVKGANDEISEKELSELEEKISETSAVVLGLEMVESAVIRILEMARKYGILTILNAAPVSSRYGANLLDLTDVLCVNEVEATHISGEQDLQKATMKLAEKCRLVIVTLGEKGAMYSERSSSVVKVPLEGTYHPLDTTGAGDAFMGALTYYLLLYPGLTTSEIIRRSCIIAAHSVQRRGTQSSYYSRKDLPAELFIS